MAKKGNKVISLNSNNYNNLIMGLLGKYRERFPKEYTAFDNIEFLMFVWNTLKMKQFVPKEKYEKMYEIIAKDGADMGLINEITDYCNKDYSSFDQFILDYDYKLDGSDFKFSVKTGGIEEYFRRIEDMYEEEDDDFEDDIMDRNAIILGYKKKFNDWAENITADYEDLIDGTSVYLIDDLEDCDEWLLDNFDEIFVKELMKITTDHQLWPQNRTYTLFKQWFKIDHSYEVIDMGFDDDDFLDDEF
jgi:hypothetical protein